MKEENQEIQQLNQALEQRNAGRDYYEFFIPGSIKLMLATSPKNELDKTAIDNYRLFFYRFRFRATRLVRQKIIDFQNKYDLSDDEVCWLKRAGHVCISRTEMWVDASRLVPISGWLQLALLCIFCIAMLSLLTYSGATAWKQGVGQTALVAYTMLGAVILSKLYLLPWRTLKQSGAIKAAKK